MFNKLKKTIDSLNDGAKTAENFNSAKKLKLLLLRVGMFLSFIGFLGTITSFIIFSIILSSFIAENGYSSNSIVSFYLLIPCLFIGIIGVIIISLGKKVELVRFSSKVVDQIMENNCPKCRGKISPTDIYCSRCGELIRKDDYNG